MEMEIFNHYNEVLSVLHYVFCHIFKGLEERYAMELSIIRQQYPSEPALISEKPLIIHWHDAMDMLEGTGLKLDRNDDLSGQDELLLGKLVREHYKTDFFALDQYPTAVRLVLECLMYTRRAVQGIDITYMARLPSVGLSSIYIMTSMNSIGIVGPFTL